MWLIPLPTLYGRSRNCIINHSRTITSEADRNHASAIPAGRSRAAGPAGVGGEKCLSRRGRRRQAEVLLPVDVPLSLGEAAYAPCAELHHRRRAHVLPPHARPPRAAA